MKQPTSTLLFDFGEVKVRRNARAKYMRIKVHPVDGVSLILPEFINEKHARNFIQEKEVWIRRSLTKSQHIKEKITLFKEGTKFSTKFHRLRIETHSKSSLRYTTNSGNITICYPEFATISDERVQSFIRHAITETLRFEAKHHLPKRCFELAEELNLSPGKISVRNNKTRWGSCSGKNTISLNIHLMRLPDKLIDYVIFHELAHIVHKNHSPKFWSYLEKVCTNAKVLDKELNKYHVTYW